MEIKIDDRMFKIVLQKEGYKEYGTDGSARASHWYQKIWIDLDKRPFDGVQSDLWHEIVEMIVANHDLKIDHPTITTLAAAIHQVLTDNRSLFEDFRHIVEKENECSPMPI